MTSAEEVGRILANAEPAARVLYLAALLSKEAGSGSGGLIVVGGSAVEIYTRGAYASADIDLVADREPILPVLKQWGFTWLSRGMWYRKDWGITVDLVAGSAYYKGSRERIVVIETPYGSVQVEAIEDSLVRRLIWAKLQPKLGDFDLAVAIGVAHAEEIDWEYAERIARFDQVSDLLAIVRERNRSQAR